MDPNADDLGYGDFVSGLSGWGGAPGFVSADASGGLLDPQASAAAGGAAAGRGARDVEDTSPQGRIAGAAERTAALGEKYLSMMQRLSRESSRWARRDRRFYNRNFRPLEVKMADEAAGFDTPERRERAAREAGAQTRREMSLADDQATRALLARGVNPASGAFRQGGNRAALATSAAVAGAQEAARGRVESEGWNRLGEAARFGRGYAVNPGTSAASARGSLSSGFQGAAGASDRSAGLYGTLLDFETAQANRKSDDRAGLFGAIGSIAGAALPFVLSSKGAKRDKQPVSGALEAVREMPVESWRYEKGVGDGGAQRHVGPYAEDFAAATGSGDGAMINVMDAVGVNMAATKELADKVDRLAAGRGVRGSAA